MPNFDGTGPNGQGPMSGRAMGPCNTQKEKTYRRGLGRGIGRGFGRGYGQGLGRGMGPRNRGQR